MRSGPPSATIAAVPAIGLLLLVSVVAAEDPGATASPRQAVATAEPPAPSDPPRRLVHTSLAAINFSPFFPVPAVDLALFLGGALPTLEGNDPWLQRAGLGYQFTASIGAADLPALASAQPKPEHAAGEEGIGLDPPIFYHRHHLALTGHGARRGRLYYSLAAGVWLARASFAGLEGELRVGYRFGVRPRSRDNGIVGGQVRLSGAIGGEPLPTFGLFLGYALF